AGIHSVAGIGGAMAYWSGTAERPDRAKAIAGVILVHAALAFVILSGLTVSMVAQTIDHLRTFNIVELPPPPPHKVPPPKPAPKPHQMKLETGASGKKAEATPVVAPRPKLPVPSPIVASAIAGTG